MIWPAYLFCIVVIILGCIVTRNIFVSILQMLLVILLFGLSQDPLDYHVYKGVYNAILHGHSADYEIGYEWINSLAGLVGLDYIEYRFFVGTFFCALLFIVVRSLTNCPNFVLSCYLVVSAMFDACLLRNSVAMGLCFLAFLFFFRSLMLKKDFHAHKVQFVVNAVLGLSFFVLTPLVHSAYWAMFLLFPMWFLVNTINGIKKVLFLIVGLYIFCVFYDNYVFSLYSNLLIREATVNLYETSSYSNVVGVLYRVFKYLLIVSPVVYFEREKYIEDSSKNAAGELVIQKKKFAFCLKNHVSVTNLHNVFDSNIIKLNAVFASILIPQYYAVNFSRLFKFIIVFNCIYLANQINKYPIKTRLIGLAYSIILVCLMLFFDSPAALDCVFFMHFKTNSLFEFFDMARNIEMLGSTEIAL